MLAKESNERLEECLMWVNVVMYWKVKVALFYTWPLQAVKTVPERGLIGYWQKAEYSLLPTGTLTTSRSRSYTPPWRRIAVIE